MHIASQSAFLKSEKIVVDGDLIRRVVSGLSESGELVEKIPQLMLQCIKISIKKTQLYINIRRTLITLASYFVPVVYIQPSNSAFEGANLGVKISNISQKLIYPKLIGARPFNIQKHVLLVSTFQ